jgi:formylglycine-generating enzyme required for sulfatase activity/serine/threonine protein kinase
MDAFTSLHPTDQTLSSYGLGKLDDRLADAVSQHLEQCPDCRKQVAEMSADSFLERVRGAQVRPDSPAAVGSSLAGLSIMAGEPGPSAPPPASTLPPGLAERTDYEVVRELGQGGMGTVYLALNRLMGRHEVLKVVSSHLVKRSGVLDRFLVEIRNAAKLHHPNVVTAYSAFRLGESVLFAMEYVEGLDLAKLVKAKGPLPVANACSYVHQAALGLQHAHEQGMVHRDIKPSNLMLSRQANRAAIKVLDFGLAKVKSEGAVDGGLTHEGQMLGTPDFIAPEQTVDARKADIRADIYSLGCTLYYLLTGGPPFQATSLYEILQAHQSMEAMPLNLARPEVPVELAALVARMMAKEPERRFQTPKEVAQSILPFFKKGSVAVKESNLEVSRTGQPEAKRSTAGTGSVSRQSVTSRTPTPAPSGKKPPEKARPQPAWESLIELKEVDRFREPAQAVAEASQVRPQWMWPGAAVGVLLLLGLVVAWATVLRVKTSNGMIELVNLPRDAVVFVDGEEVAVTWPGGGKPAVVTVTAGKHKVKVKKDGFETSGEEVTVQTGEKQEFSVRFAPLVVERHRKEKADALRANAEEHPTPPPAEPSVAGRADSTLRLSSWGGQFISLFNGRDLSGWKTHPNQPGNWRVESGVLTGSGPDVSHLFTERGDFKDFHLRLEARINKDGISGVFIRSPFVAIVPVNQPQWASQGGEGYKVWIDGKDLNFNRTGGLYPAEADNDVGLAFLDYTKLAPGQWFTLEIVAEENAFSVRMNGIPSSFHTDQKRLFSSGHLVLQQYNPQTVIEIRRIEIKELNRSEWKDPRQVGRFVGHESRVACVAFSPDGQRILSGGNSHERVALKGYNSHPPGEDNTVRLWDAESGQNVSSRKGHEYDIRALAFSSDGRQAASCSGWVADYARKTVLVWDLKTGRRTHRFSPDVPAKSGYFISAVTFSPDNRRILAAYTNGIVRSWDLDNEQEQPQIRLKGGKFRDNEFPGAAFMTDGRRLVTGSQDGAIELWDLQGGNSLQAFLGHTESVGRVTCSADGRFILSKGGDNTIRLWNVADGKELTRLKDADRVVRCIALSPDSRRALSAGHDGAIRLWDLATGKELCRLEGHTMGVNSVAFSPDGRRAVSGSDDKTVRVWQMPESGVAEGTSTSSTSVESSFRTPASGNSAHASADNPPAKITNTLGMTLVSIPAGEFMMGSPDSDRDAENDERPQHRVRITRSFYLGVHEVTQAQYEAVMGVNPSWFSANGGGKDQVAGQSTDRHPVEQVSRLDAVNFCNKLSEKDGLRPFYEIDGDIVRVLDWNGPGYRLPTEAEWEYACRAGEERKYSFGDDVAGLGEHAWYKNNSDSRTHPVGEKRANGFSLFDMHGNAWECCWDGYGDGYYQASLADDPRGPDGAAMRVRRGGGWNDFPRLCRSADRYWDSPGHRDNGLGFRVARDVQEGGTGGLPAKDSDSPTQPSLAKPPVPLRDEGGFVSLFNGRDFTGLLAGNGDLSNWDIEHGALVSRRGNNQLFTEPEFRRFILRFEFQIAADTYSSVGFWAFSGDVPAWVFLDNTRNAMAAVTWKNKDGNFNVSRLNPPAQLKPEGVWNEMEIELKDDHIRVSLNGKRLSEERISPALRAPGRDPSLQRQSGRIAFASPGSRGAILFRNIAVKRLE